MRSRSTRSKKLFAALPLILGGACAHAAELRVQGGLWGYEVSGFEQSNGNRTNLDSDLGVGRQNDGFLQLEYQHRPSWLPDVAASYTQISGAGSRTVEGGIGVGPIVIPVGSSTLTAAGDFDDVDGTLRYAIALGPLQLSPGLTVKSLRGEVITHDSASDSESSQSYSEIFPMVHAQLAWPIGDYLRLTARGDWISYEDDEAYQFGVAAEVRVLGPLGAYAGWQERHYRVSDADSAIDVRLYGYRVGLIVVF
jgi:hypothetical protein